MNYQSILACYLSGQMNEKQWQGHLSDQLFRLWIDYHRKENVK